MVMMVLNSHLPTCRQSCLHRFLGPTCMACRTTLPFTHGWPQPFQNKDLVVLAVTRDPRESVKALKRLTTTRSQLTQTMAPFSRPSTPMRCLITVILDRTGHIVGDRTSEFRPKKTRSSNSRQPVWMSLTFSLGATRRAWLARLIGLR